MKIVRIPLSIGLSIVETKIKESRSTESSFEISMMIIIACSKVGFSLLQSSSLISLKFLFCFDIRETRLFFFASSSNSYLFLCPTAKFI